MLSQYGTVLCLLLVGVLFGAAPLIINFLISPRSSGRYRDQIYESGMLPVGSAWVKFGIAYYLFALIFVAFDVDVVFLFPVALIYDDPQLAASAGKWRDFTEIGIFVGILSLAIVYAYRKGVFRWQ
ncbi:MAG: NADH-quinone oxidoreductase subunit A [Rickettsiales bacterium]|nr:NADH-quinone oxidoreductase subunit A [Rickettsiales bacterium]|tara:strand:- start:1760 stop:2137 length:378 start_codon:yes stop_codon:yes gene_type:complete